MPENCDPKNCPVNARVDHLEKEFDRYRDGSSKTHKEMYDRLGALEQNKGVVEEKLDNIDAKLDRLIEWREEQDNKPNKFLDKLKESVWIALFTAVIGFICGKIFI